MTSIDTPGDDAKIGGRPMTGVSGPSGCVRSTTRDAAGGEIGDECVKTSIMSAPLWQASLQVALKLEAVFEQAKVGDKRRRPDRVDLGDERRQLARLLRRAELLRELVDRRRARGARHARRRGDSGEPLPVPVAVGKPPTESSDLVVEDDVDEIRGR